MLPYKHTSCILYLSWLSAGLCKVTMAENSLWYDTAQQDFIFPQELTKQKPTWESLGLVTGPLWGCFGGQGVFLVSLMTNI